MIILGVETSCDDTSLSLVENGKNIIDTIISSQIDIHKEYGGVVPEIAARKHIDNIFPMLDSLLKKNNINLSNIDAIAVTVEPGLIGALLVGVTFAKALAYSLKKPLIPVNHIMAHLYSANLEYDIKYPVLGLIISGGHTLLVKSNKPDTYEILGTTIDDAVGESYDKVSKMLDLGYPGGPIIEKFAKTGNPDAINFPRPLLNKDNLNFSFSGLKTAVLYYIKENTTININDVCASFQAAVFEVLLKKTKKALKTYEIKNLVVGGGVAANKTLQNYFSNNLKNYNIFFPSIKYCTDNAAMIAGLGFHLKDRDSFDLTLNPNAKIQKYGIY
jgi:N6-L-threonylcarbamoyladenine synthase